MKKDNFVKGILVGIIMSLCIIMFMVFGSEPRGSSMYNPLYVKIVK